MMIEITQADRDAAEKAQWHAVMRVGSLAEAFARHRIAERAKIVAWLRSRDQLEDCYSELQEDWLSNRIEAREHETFTHPDNV